MLYSLVDVAYSETQASVVAVGSLEQSAYAAQKVTQRNGAEEWLRGQRERAGGGGGGLGYP